MENAADALKMAGFMLIFVAALSLAMTTLSKAKSAATAIISANNKKNDYLYLNEEGANIEYPVDPTSSYRLVGIESIIPMIYNYTQETYRIEFYKEDGTTPLDIVETDMTKSKYVDDYGKEHTKKVGGKLYVNFFDLALEGSYSDDVDDKMVGTRSVAQIEKTVKELRDSYGDKRFVEQIGKKENEQEKENEDNFANGNWVSKADEDKGNDKVKIISYKLEM